MEGNSAHFQVNKMLMKTISLSELNCSLKKLKEGKSPGPDGIPNEYLKYSLEIDVHSANVKLFPDNCIMCEISNAKKD